MVIRVIVFKDNIGLLFDKQDVEILRKEGRIVGRMIGKMRGKKMPCDEGTLPLLLNADEITLALELSLIQCYTLDSIHGQTMDSNYLFSGQSITIPLTCQERDLVGFNWTYPINPEEQLRFAVFKNLHSKNYYLTDGVKFGGDWLAYPGDPLLFHAQFVVRVVSLQETMNPLLFVASTREAHAARKHLLLAYTIQNSKDFHCPDLELRYLTFAPYDGFGREGANKEEDKGFQEASDTRGTT